MLHCGSQEWWFDSVLSVKGIFRTFSSILNYWIVRPEIEILNFKNLPSELKIGFFHVQGSTKDFSVGQCGLEKFLKSNELNLLLVPDYNPIETEIVEHVIKTAYKNAKKINSNINIDTAKVLNFISPALTTTMEAKTFARNVFNILKTDQGVKNIKAYHFTSEEQIDDVLTGIQMGRVSNYICKVGERKAVFKIIIDKKYSSKESVLRNKLRAILKKFRFRTADSINFMDFYGKFFLYRLGQQIGAGEKTYEEYYGKRMAEALYEAITKGYAYNELIQRIKDIDSIYSVTRNDMIHHYFSLRIQQYLTEGKININSPLLKSITNW